MIDIGRHIVVYGPTGSGKTTVAADIARRLGVPHIELDAIFWLPDWKQKPLEQFRAEVESILNRYPDGWVFDGDNRRVRDLILPKVDTVVWLRLPLRATFWWLLKRTLHRILNRDMLWGTNRESWRQSFFSRDSLLLFSLTRGRHTGERAKSIRESIPAGTALYELRSTREVKAFIDQLGDNPPS
jgi:adenylate kinase family enzyme